AKAAEGSVEERTGEDRDVLRVATEHLELRARGRDERAAVDGRFDERGIRLEQALDAPLFGEIRLRAKKRRPACAREARNAEHANAMEHATALRAFWIGELRGVLLRAALRVDARAFQFLERVAEE